MHEDEILCDHFHRSADDIRALRRADKTFDLICNDYLSLIDETARVIAQGESGSERYLADARDSLSGLSEEIEARLQRYRSQDETNT